MCLKKLLGVSDGAILIGLLAIGCLVVAEMFWLFY